MAKEKFNLGACAKVAIERYCAKHENLSQKDFGDIFKVTQGAVWQWMQDGVTAERAKEIETETGGEILRSDLRPDLFDAPAKARAA